MIIFRALPVFGSGARSCRSDGDYRRHLHGDGARADAGVSSVGRDWRASSAPFAGGFNHGSTVMRWSFTSTCPSGWRRPSSWGRLKRATGSPSDAGHDYARSGDSDGVITLLMAGAGRGGATATAHRSSQPGALRRGGLLSPRCSRLWSSAPQTEVPFKLFASRG